MNLTISYIRRFGTVTWLRNSIFLLVILAPPSVFLTNCDNTATWFCGEWKLENKEFLTQLNEEYNSKAIEIKAIPCEYSYLLIYFQSDNIDTEAIKEIHLKILREAENLGWRHLSVYNKNKKFLFHRVFNITDERFYVTEENGH